MTVKQQPAREPGVQEKGAELLQQQQHGPRMLEPQVSSRPLPCLERVQHCPVERASSHHHLWRTGLVVWAGLLVEERPPGYPVHVSAEVASLST